MRLHMKQTFWVMAVVVGVVLASGSGQAQAPAAQQKAEAVVVPLKVTVVMTRHKSDKAQTVVSRLPFELWVNTGSSATIRFGSEVPVPTTRFSQAEGADTKSTPVTSFNYRSIGTSVTVSALDQGEGRYRLDVSIEDSQIVPAVTDPDVGGPRTAFQSLRAATQPILRDGQTVQHSLATDRMTGDVTKIEIMLHVVK